MPFYHTQEAGFDIPAGWTDGSVNVLEYPRPEGLIRLVLARTPEGGKPLSALVEARLVEQRRQLPFYELTRRAEALTAGVPSIETVATFEWSEPLLRR